MVTISIVEVNSGPIRKIVSVLAETMHQMENIDGVIERHGGWPDAFLLTNINGHAPSS